MTSVDDQFSIDAAVKAGFEPASMLADTYICSAEQIVTLMKRAEETGKRKAQPFQMVAEMRAGPLRLEAVRVKESGKITFTMMFDNDLTCHAGEESAKLFSNFVCETLGRPQQPRARELLTEAASLFRSYEVNHRAKVQALAPEVSPDQFFINEAAIGKAERNAEIAQRIEQFLTGTN